MKLSNSYVELRIRKKISETDNLNIYRDDDGERERESGIQTVCVREREK